MYPMKNRFLPLMTVIVCFILSCQKGEDTPVEPPPVTPLTISSITPTHGAGGTNITIAGTGFSATTASNTVQINGKPATVVSAQSTSLVVTIPVKAGTGDVTLTVDAKTVTGPVLTYDTVYMVTTLAGSTGGFADGTVQNALFNKPTGICTDTDLNLYIAERGNYKIRKIAAAGQVTTLAGSTKGFTDGPAATAKFQQPMGITRDAQGVLYVADMTANAIRRIATDGTVSTIAGGTEGYSPGSVTTAMFYQPAGICVASSGAVYLTDFGNHLVRNISGTMVNNVAGYACQSGWADGTGNQARLNGPLGMCIDAQGSFYVADTYGQRIRKVTAAGVVTTIAGSDMQGKADGTGNQATFFQPGAICVDATGNLYVADTENHLIRKITPAGVVTTIAGTGNTGKADGIGTAASFNSPAGICVDAQGALYVADTYNNLIRKIVQQ
jgi:sugar lactone lactonase YvrE